MSICMCFLMLYFISSQQINNIILLYVLLSLDNFYMYNNSESLFGLCEDCVSLCDWTVLRTKHPKNVCAQCRKDEPDVIHNEEAFCITCYMKIMSPVRSVIKTENSELRGHKKSKSYYRPVNKK